MKDKYRLAPWTRGWLSYTHSFFEKATGTGDEMDQDDDVMLPMLQKAQVEMFSKAKVTAANMGSVRFYNYYTYRRTRDYTDTDLKRRYRAMPNSIDDAGRLVDRAHGDGPSWERFVENEDYPQLEPIGSENGNKRSSTMPSLTPRAYNRYEQFKTWSY